MNRADKESSLKRAFSASIRVKVILPYLLLTLLIAVTGAFVVTRLVASTLVERLSNQLLEAGRVVSDSFAGLEIQHIENARMIGFTQGLGDALRDGDIDSVSAIAKPSSSGLNIENLAVYDLQGRLVLHLHRDAQGAIVDVTNSADATSMAMVPVLLSENNYDSPPRRDLGIDALDNKLYYFTALPIASGKQVVGVIMVGTSLDTFMPRLRETALADIILYDESGNAIATTLQEQAQEQDLFLSTLVISQEAYQQALNAQGVVEGENIVVNARSYSLARGPLQIGADRLGVFAVVLPANFVVQSGTVSRNAYAILFSVAMIIMVVVGYFVSRMILDPIAKLVQTSQAITKGDLSRRVDIQSRDEIGMLADTFDTMTERLQQRTVELEKANRILEQMDRAKSDFIKISAHELRTPLTLIQGYSQILQDKVKADSELGSLAEGINNGASRMMEIFTSVLDISRIDNKTLDLSPRPTGLAEVIDNVRLAFASSIVERKQDFKIEGLEALPEIKVDPGMLYKVFYHLIMNAIKYTPDGGAITVRGRLAKSANGSEEVEVSVHDTGIGIDPRFSELVFEKFFQTGEMMLHSSGKTKYKGGGPGLGLAVARGIVEAHGGRIWLESPGHDEATHPGATFYVRLPIKDGTK
jgi:signal transduction histidine kinase